MAAKDKKLFGVWMDSHHATIVGNTEGGGKEFTVLAKVKNAGPDNNSNENASNSQEIALTHKFFKEIAGHMPNMEEIHITGTGQIQEQFMRYLSETPQHKNATATESTSNKMSDEDLALFIMKHFN